MLSELDLVVNGYGVGIVPEEFFSILPKNVKLLSICDEKSI